MAGLRLDKAASGERFLAWRSLSADCSFGLAPDHLDIAQVRVLQPEVKIVIFPDRKTNLGNLLKVRGEGAASAFFRSESATFPMRVAQLQIERGEVDFAISA
ncbi:hypothetical protein JCM13664_12540 [Methylothermus subterraneus]